MRGLLEVGSGIASSILKSLLERLIEPYEKQIAETEHTEYDPGLGRKHIHKIAQHLCAGRCLWTDLFGVAHVVRHRTEITDQ